MIHKGKHVKVYLDYFGSRVCEITGVPGGDIHHIEAAGMGGRDSVHVIENLMCLERKVHEFYGDKTEFKEWLREVHAQYMEDQIPLYQRSPSDENLQLFIHNLGKVRFLL